MKEYSTADPQIITNKQEFKVKIGAGTASIQYQADTEGFDEMDGGAFSASGSGNINMSSGKVQAVLTGDARFFMGALQP
jgi:hypothetical protein